MRRAYSIQADCSKAITFLAFPSRAHNNGNKPIPQRTTNTTLS